MDKHKNYCWVDCSSKSHAVVTRTLDGNVQHIEGGAIHLETHSASEGQGHPVAWISGDAVVLAATAAGCVDAFPWGGDDHAPGKTAWLLNARDCVPPARKAHASCKEPPWL